MHYIERLLQEPLNHLLEWSPVVGIIGARQVGKSTLAKQIVQAYPNGIYLDLEDPSKRLQIQDPMFFFAQHSENLICLDEVQSVPDLFVSIKASVDKDPRPGRFLLLGSASPALLRQSAESLAGRIIYQQLGPFSLLEYNQPQRLWLRGGFPRSLLAPTDQLSMSWRNSFIQTFLERDLLQLKQGVSPARMRMLWSMIAHLHGQIINYSMISRSMDVSGTTITNYLDLLEGALMIERIAPYHINSRKRLVKSPKLYFSDTGILHSFLGISSPEALLIHPIKGTSLESFVLQNIRAALPDHRVSFYRTAKGAELDFILEKDGIVTALEVKSSSTPHLTKGFWIALEDVKPAHTWIVAPLTESYDIKENITISSLEYFLTTMVQKQ